MLRLVYIRDGSVINFTVADVKQAVLLANAIADSDLLNDKIDYNMFDLEYMDGEPWFSKDHETFDGYFQMEGTNHE